VISRFGIEVQAGGAELLTGKDVTPAGRQAQVDWGHFGTIDVDGVERKLWGFAAPQRESGRFLERSDIAPETLTMM
jgi:hypothetical protein